jgi:hypothetical protein
MWARRAISVILAGALLSGCAAARQEQTNKNFNTYLGRSVAELALKLGPPQGQIPMGGGKMGFQWVVNGSYTTPGIAVPVGSTVVYDPPETQLTQCRMSVTARTTQR